MAKRNEEIDIVRVISCIAVVLIHITASYIGVFDEGSIQRVLVTKLNLVMRFAVPVFIMVNGFVMFLRYRDDVIELKSYYRKMWYRIILPYLAWTTLYLLYYLVRYNIPISLASYIKAIRTGSASYHIYYMVLIIQFYLALPLILWIYKKLSQPWVFLGLGILVNILVNEYFSWTYRDRFFANYIVFYIFGMFVADQIVTYRRKLDQRVPILLIYIMTLAFYLTFYIDYVTTYLWWVYSCITFIFLYMAGHMVLGSRWYKPLKPLLKSLAGASFGIYLLHPMVMNEFDNIGLYQWLSFRSVTLAFFLEIVIVFAITWLIVVLFAILMDISKKKLYNVKR